MDPDPHYEKLLETIRIIKKFLSFCNKFVRIRIRSEYDPNTVPVEPKTDPGSEL